MSGGLSLYKEEVGPQERDVLWMGYVNHGELNLPPEALLRGMRAFNAEVRRLARARGLLLIDPVPAVPRDLEHFYDDCHLTSQGNRAVARCAVEALLKKGELP